MSASLTFQEVRDYIKTLAERHRTIEHTSKKRRFFELGMEKIVTGNDLPDIPRSELFMVLEPLEYGHFGDDPDFQKRMHRGAFIICQNTDEALPDVQELREIFNSAQEVGDDMIKKMYQEAESANLDADSVIKEAQAILNFDETQVEAMEVGPILNNCYGVRFTFSILDEVDLVNEDPDKWL